jgi:hypothetical protein
MLKGLKTELGVAGKETGCAAVGEDVVVVFIGGAGDAVKMGVAAGVAEMIHIPPGFGIVLILVISPLHPLGVAQQVFPCLLAADGILDAVADGGQILRREENARVDAGGGDPAQWCDARLIEGDA